MTVCGAPFAGYAPLASLIVVATTNCGKKSTVRRDLRVLYPASRATSHAVGAMTGAPVPVGTRPLLLLLLALSTVVRSDWDARVDGEPADEHNALAAQMNEVYMQRF